MVVVDDVVLVVVVVGFMVGFRTVGLDCCDASGGVDGNQLHARHVSTLVST